jgi:hypothetical protein
MMLKPTRVLGHGPPVPRAVLLDVGDEDDVLLRRPWPFLDSNAVVTARRPPHAASLLQPQIHLYLAIS